MFFVTQFSTDVVPQPNNWAVAIICFLLLMLCLIVVPFRRKLLLVFKAHFTQRHNSMLQREGRIFEERIFPFTLCFDLMSFALGILVVCDHVIPQIVQKFSYIGSFAMILVTLMVLYFLKMLANYIYTVLFDHQRECQRMNLGKFVFLTAAAILLLPFVVVAQIVGIFPVLYAYIPLFGVLLILYFINLAKINPKSIHLLHFFIYFCTSEILPYVLLVKFITTI